MEQLKNKQQADPNLLNTPLLSVLGLHDKV